MTTTSRPQPPDALRRAAHAALDRLLDRHGARAVASGKVDLVVCLEDGRVMGARLRTEHWERA